MNENTKVYTLISLYTLEKCSQCFHSVERMSIGFLYKAFIALMCIPSTLGFLRAFYHDGR